jgi:stage IV sporulation protein FB
MKIARIKGVDIKTSPVFIILAAVGVCLGYFAKGLVLVATVLLHEMAHLMVAKVLGFKIREVVFFPLGGVVRIEGLFQLSPAREIIIAAAGPITNILLAFFTIESELYKVIGESNANSFIAINTVIAGFNLIPALPLDGGRILRAILSWRWGIVRATKFVTALGRIIAVIMFISAVYKGLVNPLSITMAAASFFLFFASGTERKMAPSLMIKQAESKKKQLFSRGMLKSRSFAVAYNTSVKKVINSFLPGYYHIIFVIGNNGKVMGKISEEELIKGIMEYGYNTEIGRLIKIPEG